MNFSRLIIFFIVLFCSTNLFAQFATVDATGIELVKVSTSARSPISIGGTTVIDMAVYNNTYDSGEGNSQGITKLRLTNVIIEQELPLGVKFERVLSTDITAVTEGQKVTFTVKGESIDPQNFNGPLVFSYEVKATCALIGYMAGTSGTDAANLVNHKSVMRCNLIKYQDDGTYAPFEYSEVNGSASYAVMVPDLQLGINADDINREVVFKDRDYYRSLYVTNTGTATLKEVSFYVKVEGGLTFKALYVKPNANATDLALFTQVAEVTTDRVGFKKYVLKGTLLGSDLLFSPGEKVYLGDKVGFTIDGKSLATDYLVEWGDGFGACNEGSSDGKITAYLGVVRGSPSLSLSASVQNKGVPCGELDVNGMYVLNVNVSNSGFGSLLKEADAGFNMSFEVRLHNKLLNLVGHVYDYVSLVKPDGSEVLLSLGAQNVKETVGPVYNYYNFNLNNLPSLKDNDIDGVGGLVDMDNDRYYDDLPVGNTLKLRLRFYYQIPEGSLYSSLMNSVTDKATYSLFVRSYAYSPAAAAYYSPNYFQSVNGPQGLTGFDNQMSISGIQDPAFDGNEVEYKIAYVGMTDQLYNTAFTQLKYEVTLPPFLTLSQIKYNSTVIPPLVQGLNTYEYNDATGVLTIYPAHISQFTNGRSLSVYCKVKAPSDAAYNKQRDDIDVWYNYYFTTCNSGSAKITLKHDVLSIVNPTYECTGLTALRFSATRTTLGYDRTKVNNLLVNLDGGSKKLTYLSNAHLKLDEKDREALKIPTVNNGINLQNTLPGDSVTLKISGQNTGDQPSAGKFVIEYLSPVKQEMIVGYKNKDNSVNGKLIIDGQEKSLSGVSAQISEQPDLNGKYLVKLEFGMGGIELQSGQLFSIEIYGQMTKMNDWTTAILSPNSTYCLDDFVGYFVDNINGMACQRKQSSLMMFVPEKRSYPNNWTYVNCSSPTLLAYGRTGSNNNINPFLTEYRPVVTNKVVEFTLPTGLTLKRDVGFSNPRIRYRYFNHSWQVPHASDIVIQQDKISLLSVENNVETWRVKLDQADMAVDVFSTIPWQLLGELEIKDHKQIVQPSNYGYYYKLGNTVTTEQGVDNIPFGLGDDGVFKLDNYVASIIHNQLYKGLSVEANEIQEGYKKEVAWPVKISYTGNSGAPTNTFFVIDVDENDASTKITKVVLTNANGTQKTLDLTPVGAKRYVFYLADLAGWLGYSREFQIYAEYNNCIEDALSRINLYTGWRCSAFSDTEKKEILGFIPSEATSLEDFLNGYSSTPIKTADLYLRYKTAGLQWQVGQSEPLQTQLCDKVQYSIDLLSSRFANMYDINLEFTLPKGLSLANYYSHGEPGRILYTHSPESGIALPEAFIDQSIDATTGQTTIKINVSDFLKDIDSPNHANGELPGTINSLHSKFDIDFKLLGNCDFDPGKPIVYKVSGITNCKDYTEYIDQRKIVLKDFPLDEISISTTAAPFDGCGGLSHVGVSLSNMLALPTSQQQLVVKLPGGMVYKSVKLGSADYTGTVQVKGNADDGTTLTLDLPAGFLAAKGTATGVTKVFDFEVQLATGSFTNQHTYNARTIMNGQATCLSSGENCTLVGTTGEHQVTVASPNVFKPMVTITKDVSDKVCPGTPIILSATPSPLTGHVYTYNWSLSNNVTKSTANTWRVSAPSTTTNYYVVATTHNCASDRTEYTIDNNSVWKVSSISGVKSTPTSCKNETDGVVQFQIKPSTDNLEAPYKYTVFNSKAQVLTSATEAIANTTYEYAQLPVANSYRINVVDQHGCVLNSSFNVGDGSPLVNAMCVGYLPATTANGQNIDFPLTLKVTRTRLAPTQNPNYRFDIVTTHNGKTNSFFANSSYPEARYGTTTTFNIQGLTYNEGAEYKVVLMTEGEEDCSGEPVALSFAKSSFSLAVNGGLTRIVKCFPDQEVTIDAAIQVTKADCDNAGAFSYLLSRVEDSGDLVTIQRVDNVVDTAFAFNAVNFADGRYCVEAMGAPNNALFSGYSQKVFFDLTHTELKVEIDPASVKHVSCEGGDDGEAMALAIGDFRSFTYAWYEGEVTLAQIATLKPFSNAARAVGLKAGKYTVVVGAETQCVGNYSVPTYVTINDGITVALPVISDPVDCMVTATLPLPVTGNDYTFTWVRHEYFVKSTTGDLFEGKGVLYPKTKSVGVDHYVPDNTKVAFTNNQPVAFQIPEHKLNGEINVPVERFYNDVYSERLPYTTADETSATNELVNAVSCDYVEPNYFYHVVVKTQNGCTAQSEPKYVPMPASPRNYNIQLRWTTVPKEMQKEMPEQISEVTPTMDAAKRKETVSNQVAQCEASKTANLKALADEYCFRTNYFADELSVKYGVRGQNFTLYYYDRAGNLTKTVPPAGVFAGSETDPVSGLKKHTLATTYKYNSLKQMVEQNTPDGGTTRFVYNKKGQLRFSQNAKQASDAQASFSYTLYDPLGRVIEVGECLASALGSWDNAQTLAEQPEFPNDGALLSQQTKTYYSNQPSELSATNSLQRHTLNRIARTEHINPNPIPNKDVAVTYYSYDPHGNVEFLEQLVPGLDEVKRIDYQYDLISGKVTQVSYNKGKADAFYHRYSYDEDNRLTSVETSVNGVVWDHDASYDYYLHGPLKRTELGQYKVQGLDYVYTINGWLKAINHPSLNPTDDPGGDGTTSGRDVFAMMLTYFDGDYKNYNNDNKFMNSAHELKPAKDLFNGNIAAWTTNTAQRNGSANMVFGQPVGQQFEYDNLNRLLASNFSNYDGAQWKVTNDFKTAYTYDGNGNIQSLLRNGKDLGTGRNAMDNLAYQYKPNSNQLASVTDAVTSTQKWDYDSAEPLAKHDDIDSQPVDNYSYDAIGNLIGDKSENMAIEWTAYGKVAKITKTDSTSITFAYDAAGNRIKKAVTNTNGLVTTTYYVRDASGNVMAVYDETDENKQGATFRTLALKEQPIYGSSRVGMYVSDLTMRQLATYGNTTNFTDITNDANTLTGNTLDSWTLPTAEENVTTYFATATFAQNDDGTWARTFTQGSAPVAATDFNPVVTANNAKGGVAFTFAKAGADHFYILNAAGTAVGLPEGAEPLMAQPGNAAQAVPYPGADGSYLLLTIAEGHLYGRQITVDADNNVTVAATNLLLAQGTFLNAMAAVSDQRRVAPQANVYLLQNNADNSAAQVVCVTLTVDNGSLTAQTGSDPLPLAAPAHGTNRHHLAFAPDGRKLAVALNNAVPQLALCHYNLKTRTLAAMGTPVTDNTWAGATVNSLVWGPDNASLYYTATNGAQNTINRVDADNLAVATLPTDYQCNLIAGSDGLLYAVGAQRAAVEQVTYNGNALAKGAVADLSLATKSTATFTGIVPGAPLTVATAPVQPVFSRALGRRRYELTDHLGNVRAVVGDRLYSSTTANGTVVYRPELLSYNDYYPFGMNIKSLSGNSSEYRYGYNGKEKDDKGEWGMTHYDYGFRVYNPAIAKFLSVDPLTKEYPELTPYQFASNTPIQAIDLDGLEAFFINGWDGLSSKTKDAQNSEDLSKMVKYWTNNNPSFVSEMVSYFEYKKEDVFYFDGSQGGATHGDVNQRRINGYNTAVRLMNDGTIDFSKDITIFGHSQGGAYADGMTEAILERIDKYNNTHENKIGVNINLLLLAPDGAEQFSVDPRVNTIQLTYGDDGVVTDNKATVGGVDIDLNPNRNEYSPFQTKSTSKATKAHSAPIDAKGDLSRRLGDDKVKVLFNKK